MFQELTKLVTDQAAADFAGISFDAARISSAVRMSRQTRRDRADRSREDRPEFNTLDALLRRTAYHEAGHAVMIYRFDSWIRENGVSINRNGAGRCHTHPLVSPFEIENWKTGFTNEMVATELGCSVGAVKHSRDMLVEVEQVASSAEFVG